MYINAPLLERYYAVGGVRIEDDILVTPSGYENLTTAAKGEEMLRLINDGWSVGSGVEREERGGGGRGDASLGNGSLRKGHGARTGWPWFWTGSER